MASDGVELHAEVLDSISPVTVVFCHGCLFDSESWQFQQAAFDGQARLVTWDHRGHGLSGWGLPRNANIDQLGQDLFAVLQATAPESPVVLVGHSMGGMAILGLADSHPELFGDRVVATALISCSAGKLGGVMFGLPHYAASLLQQFLHTGLSVLGRKPGMAELLRGVTSRLPLVVAQRCLFSHTVAEPVPELTRRAVSSIPTGVLAEFVDELKHFDKTNALAPLGRVPTLVLVGERDSITPVSHSEFLVNAILGSELVVVPRSGHLLTLESPQQVNEQLRRLLALAAARHSGRKPQPTCTSVLSGCPGPSVRTGSR